MKKFVICILLLVCPQIPAVAQDDATIPYQSKTMDGSLSFDYLSEWSLWEAYGTISLTSAPDFFDHGIPAVALEQYPIVDIRVDQIERMLNETQPDAPFEENIQSFYDYLQTTYRAPEYSVDELIFEPLAGKASFSTSMVRFFDNSPYVETWYGFIGLDLGNGKIITCFIRSPFNDSLETFVTSVRTLVETFEYIPSSPSQINFTPTQHFSFQAETLPISFEVYEAGIYVFYGAMIKHADLTGKVSETFEFEQSYTDFAVDADGTFWLTGGDLLPEIDHYDAAGNLINSLVLETNLSRVSVVRLGQIEIDELGNTYW